MLNIPYVGLHNHTDFSNTRLLDSINKTESLIDYAHELGLGGIALTDHACLSSHIKGLKHLAKRRATHPEDKTWQNFRLILGEEIYLCREGLSRETFISGEDKFYHFILLAKDAIGHRQLRELSSRAWKRSFYRTLERVPTYYSDIEEVIGNEPGHLVGSTACLGGRLPSLLLEASKYKGKDEEAYQNINHMIDIWIDWMIEVFGKDNFFLEKQPSLTKEQWIVNGALEELAMRKGLSCLITTDAHYLREKDRPIHKAYLNAKEGDREVDEFYASTYVMDSSEVLAYFEKADQLFGDSVNGAHLQDIVERDLWNTQHLVAAAVKEYDLAHSPIIPRTKLDWFSLSRFAPFTMNGVTYEYINKFANSPYEQDQYFISKVMQQLTKKLDPIYLEPNLTRYYERIEVECRELWNVSEKLGQRLSAYLLLVAEIVNIIWDEGDSLVGVGRGSSSGFLTNYLLGIIQIDPLRADVELPYWRFISEHRVSLPDIDLDTQSNRREKILGALRRHFGGEHRVINVATFGTEKSKSAIQTAARGLGISDDEAIYLSSMVPSERGFLWSLHDCFYGNPEEGRAPVKQFAYEMTHNYPELWTVAQHIEGLISRRGIHAAGILIANEDFHEHNAIMKAPNGAWTSQYELQDTEYLGGVKLDLLSIEALDKIRVALDLLIEYNYIEKYASLKNTYMAVLDPTNKQLLNYTNPAIWDLVAKGEVLSLFQLDTPVGMTAAKQVKPRNITELSIINSLMRLMASEGEMPLDTFMRYRENPQLWQSEMESAGLSKKERSIMEEHLASRYGVAESQESMMILAMDKQIAGFSVAEADTLRKAVAKKSSADFDKMQELFYKRGRELGTSEALLKYVWEVQVKRQKGYSFSQNHTYVYSLIALQELNLVYNFPPLFWNTANLIVDSGGNEDEPEENIESETAPAVDKEEIDDVEEDEDETVAEEPTVKKTKTKTVNYGKIGTALGKMKSVGVTVNPPNINKSKFTFTPDIENNTILFGIKGIAGISDQLAREIINNRPYSSLQDLVDRAHLTKPKIVNLIKSGALDKICGRERVDIIQQYISDISDTKSTLNLRNMQMLIEMGLIPVEMDFYRRLFNFNKYLKKSKQGIYYALDDQAMRFFEENYNNGLLVSLENGLLGIEQKLWDKTYTKAMNPMRDYIKNNLAQLLAEVNSRLTKEMWDKYATGSLSKWEMDSLSYYVHEHELARVNFSQYGIEDFFSHSEEPEIATFKHFGGRPVPIFKLWRIAGTVLDRDKTKHIVTLSTTTGVVNVRVWQNQFVKYDKQISVRLPSGKKKIIEKSWFSRGNKLLITGIRRGDNFFPKTYKNNRYEYPIELITGISEDGALILEGERGEQ